MFTTKVLDEHTVSIPWHSRPGHCNFVETISGPALYMFDVKPPSTVFVSKRHQFSIPLRYHNLITMNIGMDDHWSSITISVVTNCVYIINGQWYWPWLFWDNKTLLLKESIKLYNMAMVGDDTVHARVWRRLYFGAVRNANRRGHSVIQDTTNRIIRCDFTILCLCLCVVYPECFQTKFRVLSIGIYRVREVEAGTASVSHW